MTPIVVKSLLSIFDLFKKDIGKKLAALYSLLSLLNNCPMPLWNDETTTTPWIMGTPWNDASSSHTAHLCHQTRQTTTHIVIFHQFNIYVFHVPPRNDTP